jgi:hypothetical protein
LKENHKKGYISNVNCEEKNISFKRKLNIWSRERTNKIYIKPVLKIKFMKDHHLISHAETRFNLSNCFLTSN